MSDDNYASYRDLLKPVVYEEANRTAEMPAIDELEQPRRKHAKPPSGFVWPSAWSLVSWAVALVAVALVVVYMLGSRDTSLDVGPPTPDEPVPTETLVAPRTVQAAPLPAVTVTVRSSPKPAVTRTVQAPPMPAATVTETVTATATVETTVTATRTVPAPAAAEPAE